MEGAWSRTWIWRSSALRSSRWTLKFLHHFLAGWHSVFHQLGVKHAAGGNGMLCEAMARCVRHYGGIIRTNSTVRRVVIRDNTAVGVELSSGELIEGKIVVSSADPKQTFLQ